MKQPGHTWIIIALTMLAVTSGNARAAGWLTFYPTDIEAVARFYSVDRRSNNNHSLDTEWRAGIRISKEGYSLDPGIARFLLKIEPLYAWGKFDSTTLVEDRNINFLSYLFQLNLLNGTPGPFAFDLSVMRNSNLNTGSLGSRYDNQIENRSATFRWKNAAFPMRLIYAERSLIQDFVSGLSNSRSERDEQLKLLTLRGRSSKLDLLVERQSMDDRVLTRNNDFDVDRAYVMHRFPWGDGSQLRSRVNYYDRTGFNANKRLTINETTRIQHTDDVFSRSTYRYYSVTQDIKTIEHNGEFELVHQLYNNLTSTARAYGRSRSSDTLDETRWRTGLETQYRKRNLFGIGVNGGLGFYYQRTNRNSNMGLAEVIDEPGTASLSGVILLKRRFVILPTIIVTDADGVLVYTEGIDYIALELPEDLTQLQIIPGGRIESGDTVLVSYKAQVLPSQEFSTTYTQYNFGINLGWVRLSHYDRKSDDKLLSGAGESFLKDNRNTVTNLEFNWKMRSFNTTVAAERRFYQVGNFKSTAYTFRQLLSWKASNRLLLNLNMVESFTNTTTLNTDLYNLQLTLDWQPLIGLSVRPTLGAWKRLDKGNTLPGGSRDDTFITAGFTLRWLYRKVSMDLGYHHNRRTTNADQTVENRVMFNLRRRF